MFITGPDVIRTVTGESKSSFEELGGAMSHNTKSGVAHFASDDEEQLPRADARYLLSVPALRTTSRLPPRVDLRPTIRCARTTELDTDRARRAAETGPTTCAR